MYANIIVDISHEKLDKIFQYKIPEELLEKTLPGVSVLIPFGKANRSINGFVLEVTDVCDYDESKIKSIISINEKNVQIEGTLINLAWFIKHNYGATMNQALKTVIPIKQITKDVIKKTIRLKCSKQEAEEHLIVFEKKHATARLRLLQELVKTNELDYSLVVNKLNISRDAINGLEKLNIIQIDAQKQYRNPIDFSDLGEYKIELNEEQKIVSKDILNSDKKVHVIHGVTGSGKTEVYMDIIDKVISEGKQVIVLIPEIALTYQTVMRFYRKFGDRVSIINSKLSNGERYDQFERAKKGEIDIMIGPRSAIFTPFERLGLIVIDEEHETTYKSENVPKYHAREVAIYRAGMADAKVILGSATPSVDTYYRCEEGKYVLHRLSNRAVAKKMADVSIVDLREELKAGNKTMFSRKLTELINDRLSKKEQVMLFINKRGYAGFVSCRSCGKSIKCPHCDVGLNLHNNGKLVCHYCGYEVDMVKKCPTCGSEYIAAFGTGTQKVEESVKKIFPSAKVLRMDMDTTSKKDGHEKILSAFANKEADILVGTQMIVKGHDFPNVTLVGVIAADLSLFAADYRSNERTFDLLTQAAGRAGRGLKTGEVVIQTYNPEEYSIIAASKQDYEDFYSREIIYRSLNGYPPVVDMIAILMTCADKDILKRAGEKIRDFIGSNRDNIEVIGPADCNIGKISDMYREVIYIKSKDVDILVRLKDNIDIFKEANEEFVKVNIQFDMNPIVSY